MKIKTVSGIMLILLYTSLLTGFNVAISVSGTNLTGEIAIGALLSMTGDLATFGENHRVAAELAVEEVNAFSQASGMSWVMNLVAEDTVTKPDICLEKVESLAARGIELLIGPLSSAEVRAIKSYCDSNKILATSQSSTAPDLAIADDYIFRFCATDRLGQGPTLARIMYDDGKRYVIPVTRNDAGGVGLEDAVELKFEGLGGIFLPGIRYDPEAVEFTAEVASLATKVSDAIAAYGADEVAILHISFEEVTAFMTACMGYPVLDDVKWYGSDGTCTSGAMLDYPAVRDFAMSVEYPCTLFGPTHSDKWEKVRQNGLAVLGREPDSYAYMVYDIVWVYALSLLEVDAYDSEAVKAVLPTVTRNYFGASGWIELDVFGDREAGDYDIWQIVEIDGYYDWEVVGKYLLATDSVVWSPLVPPPVYVFEPVYHGKISYVVTESNSIVSDYHFDPREGPIIMFNVTGLEGTIGFCRVAIPKQLLWVEDGDWAVLVDGDPVDAIVFKEDDYYTHLHFTYSHSTKTVQVVGTHTIPLSPVATFSYSPESPRVGETVTFDATASNDPDGTFVNYAWNFGDGTFGAGMITYHAYVSGGDYNVTLTVTDNDGLTDTAEDVVTVTPARGDVIFDLTYYYPGGVVPGVAPGGVVIVDVYVDASALPDLSPEGMMGWGLYVSVDPAVLTPMGVVGEQSGYFLYDWINATFQPGHPYSLGLLVATGANYIECANMIKPMPPFGAGGTGKLVTLIFQSQSETAYSPIIIVVYKNGDHKSGYQDATGTRYPITAINGHYNMPPNGMFLDTLGAFPTGDPTGSDWHELEPNYCHGWTLESWVDQGDGVLSPSDRIAMSRVDPPDPSVYWFHVEWVTPAPVAGDDVADLLATRIPIPIPPSAAFTFSPDEPVEGEAVTFDASASYDPDGTVVSYAWDFGDGVYGSGVIVEHAYATAGTYIVALTITDNDGLADTASTSIVCVTQPSIASVAIEPDRIENISPGESFTIDLTVADAYDTQSWEANVTFDPTVLEVVSCAEGEFLKRKGFPTVFLFHIRPERILLAAAYLMIGPPGSGVTGDGFLANITFRVKARGATPIHFDEEYTTLVFNDGVGPVLQPRLLHDGFFTNMQHPYIAVIARNIVDPDLTPGENFTVSIYTDYNGSDVTGWQIMLSYNPYVLHGVAVTNGDLITTDKDPNATFIAGTFDNTVGRLSLTGGFFFFIQEPAPITSGPGILANVTFEVVGTGDSPITIEDHTLLIGYTEGGYGDDYHIIDAFMDPTQIQHGYFCNTMEPPIHDIAVLSVTPDPTSVELGGLVNITVVVENQGTESETFDVTVYYDTTTIEMQSVSSLAAGANIILTFTWDTTGILPATYSIRAEATVVEGEVDTSDNMLVAADVITVSSAPGEVIFDLTYYYPGGVVPGVAPGGFVVVDVYVDASALTPELGIHTWGLKVVVDPAVLTPVAATGGDVGYFLYDWSEATYGIQPVPPFPLNYPPSFLSSVGLDYIECAESFLPLPPTGANGAGKLCTLYFESRSKTAYSEITIDVAKSGYYDATGARCAINPVDGHYNMPPNGYWFETPHGGTFPPGDPTFSDWHELEPVFCQIWTLESWVDNGDGHLSPSDQIDMYRIGPPQPGPDPTWFHVEWVNPTPMAGDGIPDMMVTRISPGIPPLASFTFWPAEPVEGEAVTFDASASNDPDGTVVSYAWDFGDGVSGSGVIVEHAYATAGTYIVVLTITDNDGLADTASTSIVCVTQPSIASVAIEPDRVEDILPGETFDVNVTVSNVTDLYAWGVLIWFDPTILNATSFTRGHFFEKAGYWTEWQLAEMFGQPYGVIDNTAGYIIIDDIFSLPLPPSGVTGSGTLFTVNFTVKDVGATLLLFDEELTKLLTVVGGNTFSIPHETVDGVFDNRVTLLPPDASFDVDPPVAKVNETITFNASASNDPDGTVVSYAWDFGDGTFDSGMIVQHAYVSEGDYSVMLTVADNDGLTDTASDVITVSPAEIHDIAVISVSASPTQVTAGELVTIAATATNQGDFTEVFSLIAYYDTTMIEVASVTLDAGETSTGTFTWDTTGVPPGTYIIRAEATVVEGEVDIGDNMLVNGTVTVTLPPAPPMLSIKLSGEHDYLFMEDVKVRLAALVKDAATMEPVSEANVTIEIYDPDGVLWLSDVMVEMVAGTGIYEWQSERTMRQLRLEKGVYLVHVQASCQGGPTASDILAFHIDPPAEGTNRTLYLLAFAAVALTGLAGLILSRQQVASRLRRLNGRN